MTSAREKTPPVGGPGQLLGAALGYSFFATTLSVLLLVAHKSAAFAGLFDVQMGLFSHLAAFVILGVVPGAIAALLELTLGRGRYGRGSFAAVLALLAGATGYGVGGGRHLASFALRGGFAVGVGALAFAVAFVFFPRIARLREERPKTFLGGVVGLFALCWTLNRIVLVRLYPAFHISLGALEIVLLVMAGLHAIGSGRALSKFGYGITALALLAVVPTARVGARLDNFRFVVTEESPALGLGITLCSKLAPSPPVDRSVLTRGLGARRSRTGELDLRGRSILLVTVDALRADHLGSYGYGRPTTPFLDELAKKGTRFSAAYAATPHTSYSLTSLMTGKYMRPLLLQGAGGDSETWPRLLQTYGYRTAGFYPPAVFFIDGEHFARFRDTRFEFEYAKVEFAEGELRVGQVESYFAEQPQDRPIFAWVHLFGPHEPYVEGSVSFGPRDMDRYDSEVRAADDTIRALVGVARARDPRALVIVSADHGEEFGEHGGRYHGTSVYEEQIRVPLVLSGEGIPEGRVVAEPVQTIDLLPTVLGALDVPIPPRLRGRDLRPLLAKEPSLGEGRAVAETEDYTLLAQGKFRLVCERKAGSCKLFDLEKDPVESEDASERSPKEFAELREISRAMAASHGEYEAEGLRAEGKNYPAAILRGLAGDTDAAPELARLLDDAEPAIRRKAAELLFHLGGTLQLSAQKLALSREEDVATRAWLALGLTRGGSLAPHVLDLLVGDDSAFRRFAALALAEQGDFRGVAELTAWLSDRRDLRFDDAKLIVRLLGASKNDDATPILLASLGDVRLRPFVADALAVLGDKDAVPKLFQTFAAERYATARGPLARALFRLGAEEELASPLLRFLGVPDPMEGGLELVRKARLSEKLGGLSDSELTKTRRLLPSGVTIDVTVPPLPSKTEARGVRVVARVRASGKASLLLAPGTATPMKKEDDATAYRNQPSVERGSSLELEIPESADYRQITAVLPPGFRAKPGHFLAVDLLIVGPGELDSILFLPVREEIPPPAPKPWKPGEIEDDD